MVRLVNLVRLVDLVDLGEHVQGFFYRVARVEAGDAVDRAPLVFERDVRDAEVGFCGSQIPRGVEAIVGELGHAATVTPLP